MNLETVMQVEPELLFLAAWGIPYLLGVIVWSIKQRGPLDEENVLLVAAWPLWLPVVAVFAAAFTATWPARRRWRWWRGRKEPRCPKCKSRNVNMIAGLWACHDCRLHWTKPHGDKAKMWLKHPNTLGPEFEYTPLTPGDTGRVRAWRNSRCTEVYLLDAVGGWHHRNIAAPFPEMFGSNWKQSGQPYKDPTEFGFTELPPHEAEALDAERLGADWGTEGYQRAYRDAVLGTVRFYPSYRANLAHVGWSNSLVPESAATAHDTRLPDAEALAIWRTRPGAFPRRVEFKMDDKHEFKVGERIGAMRPVKIPLTEQAYFTNGPAFADAPVDPIEKPAPYSLTDARAEGLSKRIGEVEKAIDAMKADPVHGITHPMVGQVWLTPIGTLYRIVAVTGEGPTQNVFVESTYHRNPTLKSMASDRWHPSAFGWETWCQLVADATRRPDLEKPCDTSTPSQD